MMGNKRVSAIDRSKRDNLFNPTTEREAMQGQIEIPANNDTSKQVDKQTSNNVNNLDDFKRQTYYLSKDLIQAIALKAAIENKDKSEIVRDALKASIEAKYFNFKID